MPSVDVDSSRPEVAVVTLNRPDRLNAMSFGLVEDLHDTLDAIDRDNRCRVVVLTGAGRGFCAGLDLKETGRAPTSSGLSGPAAGMRGQAYIAALVPKMRSLRQPVVAAVNGVAVGGGLALALGADVRVAAESARFGVQFMRVGLSGTDIGVSYTLPRIVGASRAFELMLTGRVIDAAEAERIGMVSRVVPDADVVDAAVAVAEQILEHSAFGMAMTKEVMWANLAAPSLEAAIHLENRNQILASYTGNIEEAAAAFAEKRKPEFPA